LPRKANINYGKLPKYETPLLKACGYGHLDIVKYLLTSSELKEHPDLHLADDQAIIHAISNCRWDIVSYFIYDLNIEESPAIQKFLSEHQKYSSKAQSMFDKRELAKTLNSELTTNLHSRKRLKI
jgi:ankyrin repeat protein